MFLCALERKAETLFHLNRMCLNKKKISFIYLNVEYYARQKSDPPQNIHTLKHECVTWQRGFCSYD